MKSIAKVYTCRLALCCWVSLSWGIVAAQQPLVVASIRHFSIEQGSAHRQALMIGQDKTGFIWIGTADNAYRFDGQQFEGLPPMTGSVSQHHYNAGFNLILTDHTGHLWLGGSVIANERPLLIVRPGQRGAASFEQAFGHPDPFRQDVIYEFARSPTNSFRYVRTQSGTIWWHQGQGRFKKLFQHPSLANASQVSTLCETNRHTLLISLPATHSVGSRELLELDSTGRILRHQALPESLQPIGEGPDGTVYLYPMVDAPAYRVGIRLYMLSPTGHLTTTAPPLAPSHPAFTESVNMTYDPHHDVFWLTGARLLMAWHPQKGVICELSQIDFLRQNAWWFKQVVVDRTGAVWATTSNGVLLLTLEPNRFQRYLHVADDRPSAVRQGIRGMLQLGDELWVNGAELQLIDLHTGRSRFILRQGSTVQPYSRGLCPVVQDRDGTFWTGLTTILRVEPDRAWSKATQPSTFRVSVFPFYPDNSCVAFWPSPTGTLWIGSHHGLYRLDMKTGQHRPFTGYRQFGELAQNLISGFFPDRQAGGVWITASSGLYLLDTLRGITARYSTSDKAPRKIPFDELTFVHPDPDEAGLYWLATRGGGLIRWNRRTGSWQQFTRKQGLSDNTLYAIYEDHYKRLWLPSNNGLMSFGRKTHQIQVFHTENGIADEEFNLIAHYRAPDGRLFLGGLNGITAFYPDQIPSEKPVSEPLLLTQYHKLDPESGQMTNSFAQFEEEREVHLSASDRLFTLAFSLLDYRQLGKSRLWYRIENWQEKWVVQEQPELRLNSLPAGNYTIQVRAQTINGNWASPVLSIPVTVDKPVYLQTWFLLLCGLLIWAGIIVVFRWRNRRFMRETRRLEAEVGRRTAQIEADKAIIEQLATDIQENAALKARFFANVSHELRTPLTLLVGPLQYLKNRLADEPTQQLLGVLERNTNQLMTLVNDILDLTRLDNHQARLTEQPADLAQLLQQTVGNFTGQAAYLGVHLQLSGIGSPVWMLLDTQKVETVLRNLVANALHYTSTGGSIQVQLSQTEAWVEMSVTDTGSGIHADDLPHIFERYFQSKQPDKPLRGGTGIGLALCREYCTLWGGAIRVSSEPGQGSTFSVSYPKKLVIPTIDGGAAVPGRRSAVAPSSVLLARELTDMDKPATGKTILVVEDNVDMLLYIQLVLSTQYELLIARNGRQALAILDQLSQDQLPDLIISDIMMPELDGMALVGALRQQPALASIPIVLLTARVDLESRLQALRLGIADYLTKPFNEAELLVRVQNLLNRAEEQAQLRRQLPYELDVLDASATNQDIDWIDGLQQLVRKHLTSPELTVSFLAENSSMSERQLYRRTKELTGFSPNQLIQEIRLLVAHELLENQPDAMIKAVGYQVGYQNTSYFIRIYRERFGVSPGSSQRQLEQVTDEETEETSL